MHPIVVNEKMFIVDGQHRFEACRRLGLPIHYLVQRGAQAQDIIPVQNSKKWGLDDFIHFYVAENNLEYIYFAEFRERFSITMFQAMLIVRSFLTNKGKSKMDIFKRGLLKIEDKFAVEDFSYQFVKTYKSICKSQGVKKCFHLFHECYIAALVKIYKETPAVFKKLIDRLPQYCAMLPICVKIEDCLENLEKIVKKKAYYK
jgi:hypothetical protein